MFTSSCFQLFDCILANSLVYNINHIHTRRLPGESVLFRISVTFMIVY